MLIWALGCLTLPSGYHAQWNQAGDLDEDGFVNSEYGGGDCDDLDPEINPAEPEIVYSGVDEDCDPNTPDDDLDQDGYGREADCDDTDPNISPGHEETWYDGIDQDCSGGSDYDQDGDGAELSDDCDDTDPEVIDPRQLYADNDGDGYGQVALDEGCESDGRVWLENDCDDDDGSVNPGAEEICENLVDDDCDSATSCRELGTQSVEDHVWLVGEVGVPKDPLMALATQSYIDGGAISGVESNCVDVYGRDATSPQASLCGTSGTGAAASVADFQGNGVVDLLALGAGGVALLFLDPAGDLSPGDADATFGQDDVLKMGAGDLDDDVWLEVVTLGGQGDSGSLSVYSGSAQPFSGSIGSSGASGSVTWASTGADPNVLVLEDLTGNGGPDVIVGDMSSSGDIGRVWVFEGPLVGAIDSSDHDALVAGQIAADFGRSVATADSNGDGYLDLVVGASSSDLGAPNGGAAFVYFGPIDGSADLPDVSLTGPESSGAGFSTCGPIDLDSDGFDEIVVGQPGASSFAGRMVVVYGPVSEGVRELSDSEHLSLEGSPDDTLGIAVGCPGDLNGDGFDDVIGGAPRFLQPDLAPRVALLYGRGQ